MRRTRLYRHAIVFTEHGKYSNAARRSPAGYSTGTGSQTHFHPVGGGAPIIFTSVVVVDSSHLFEPKMTGNGKMQKVIAGACIAGEWERLVGAVGMVIHQREFKAQLAQDNLSFSTAYSSSSSDTGMHAVVVALHRLTPFHVHIRSILVGFPPCLQWHSESLYSTGK